MQLVLQRVVVVIAEDVVALLTRGMPASVAELPSPCRNEKNAVSARLPLLLSISRRIPGAVRGRCRASFALALIRKTVGLQSAKS